MLASCTKLSALMVTLFCPERSVRCVNLIRSHGAKFPLAVSIRVAARMVRDSPKTTHLIFHSEPIIAVSILAAKHLGEEVLDGAENCYIWRLRIPFNHVDSPRNYLSKLINYDTLLEAENSISHIDEFVRCCTETYSKEVPFGIYNVTNTGYVTTREVADLIKTHLLPDKEAKFFSDEDEFMKIAAKTPRSNCVMDNSKLLSTGIEIREVHEAIIQALRDWMR